MPILSFSMEMTYIKFTLASFYNIINNLKFRLHVYMSISALKLFYPVSFSSMEYNQNTQLNLYNILNNFLCTLVSRTLQASRAHLHFHVQLAALALRLTYVFSFTWRTPFPLTHTKYTTLALPLPRCCWF